MYNVNVPDYPQTSQDEYFLYTSIKSDAFVGFNVRNGPYGAISSDEPSDGTVHYSSDKGMDSGTFLSESKWVHDNAAQVIDLALAALVDQYWENREYVLESLIDEDPDEVVPEIQSHNDLKNLCGIVALHIKEPGDDGAHRFGI